MAYPLIATKLFTPSLRPDAVSRSRLIHRFNAGLLQTLTLVSAPAGFGKSTLVSECAAHCGRNVAWLSIDASDEELTRFLSYVIAAIQKPLPGFGDTLLALLDSPQPPESATLLSLLVNELTGLLDPLLLVLDDFHAIEAPEIDAALEFLLKHLPPHVHLVIVTREDPQLPLAHWRARGQLSEFRAADLRFNSEETAAFLEQTMKLTLTPSNINALETRTEGWIAGLQMAGISLQGRSDISEFIDAFTGSHRFVLDYLAEEVLQRQDADTRGFLLQTALLGRLNADLCNAVTQQTDAAQRLHDLENDNLFLVALDDHRRWYRYHHLFADVLRAHAAQSLKNERPSLHLRASIWFERHGHPSEAIQHALDANDPSRAAELVETIWPKLRNTAPESLFLQWMNQLNEHDIHHRPVLCAYFGLALLASDFERGVAYIDQLEKWLTTPADKATAEGMLVSHADAFSELPGLLAIARSYQAGAVGDVDGIIHHAQRALSLLDEKSAVWRGSAAVLLGLVHWYAGDLKAALEAIEEGHRNLKAGGETGGAISTLNLLANIYIALGDLKQAARRCHKGQQLATAFDGPAPQGSADIFVTLASLHIEQNQLETADALLNEAETLGEQAKLLESRHLWFLAKARLANYTGQHQTSLDLLERAAELYIPSPAPDPMPLAAWKARFQLAQGDITSVEQWALDSELSSDDELIYIREFEHITLAQLLLTQYLQSPGTDKLEQLERFLERLKQSASKGQRLRNHVDILIMESVMWRNVGDDDAALRTLSEALALAAPPSYCRGFLSAPKDLEGLLKTARAKKLYPDFISSLISESPSRTRRASTMVSESLLEPLSEREHDVLRLLASDLSGPDIADQLFISLNTLRTHTKNIYAKLGVNSRRAAVTRASELEMS